MSPKFGCVGVRACKWREKSIDRLLPLGQGVSVAKTTWPAWPTLTTRCTVRGRRSVAWLIGCVAGPSVGGDCTGKLCTFIRDTFQDPYVGVQAHLGVTQLTVQAILGNVALAKDGCASQGKLKQQHATQEWGRVLGCVCFGAPTLLAGVLVRTRREAGIIDTTPTHFALSEGAAKRVLSMQPPLTSHYMPPGSPGTGTYAHNANLTQVRDTLHVCLGNGGRAG